MFLPCQDVASTPGEWHTIFPPSIFAGEYLTLRVDNEDLQAMLQSLFVAIILVGLASGDSAAVDALGDDTDALAANDILGDSILARVAAPASINRGLRGGGDDDDDDQPNSLAMCGDCLPTLQPPAQKQNKAGYYSYEHVVRRVDSKSNCRPSSDALPVLVTVTNREVLVGCHSFDEYLSPKFRTVFVLNEDVAGRWGIDDMVEDAGCDETLGATALLLDNMGGEVLGRRVALDYSLSELTPEIEFLHQINCDVHPIPKKHQYYLSMEEIVTKMASDFVLIRAQREPHKYFTVQHVPDLQLVTNLRTGDPTLKLPVLGMSAHLFEEFPSMNRLGRKHLHGRNVCSWEGVDARPDHLQHYPWLCDNSEWVENHMMIFDIERLLTVRRELLDAPASADVDSYPSSTKLTSRVAHEYGMTVLTNQDVYAHQNFAHAANFEEETLPKIQDWLRVASLETLASTRSPQMNSQAWHGYRDYAGYTVRIGNTAMGFMIRETQDDDSPWWPDDPEDVDEEHVYRIVTAMFKICGYELLGEEEEYLEYGLVGVYPANLYIDATTGGSSDYYDDSWEFLQLKDRRGRTYRYTAVGSVATDTMRKMSPKDRTVRVPKDAKLRKIPDSPTEKNLDVLNQRGQFNKHERLECYADDHDEGTYCGYLDSPRFKYPYD